MKKKFLRNTKKIFLSFSIVMFFLSTKAQKEKISDDIIKKVAEITKPVKEQIDKLLEQDGTGTYKAYLEEVKNLGNLKDENEKSMAVAQIRERYLEFFTEIWKEANIDEKGYQQKIRGAFPYDWGSNLEFQPFLNIVCKSSSNKKNIPPPSLPPVPENKCVDVCLIAAGEINGTADLISGGGGSYGNCFIKSHGWSKGLGKNELFGYLRNNISIPGTFPNDTRSLRVKKTYNLTQQATSFAILGFGYSETWVRTFQSYEYMYVISPVIFMASKTFSKTMQEEYLLAKANISQSKFSTYAGTFSFSVSGNWCFTACNNIQWSVCEEGK